MTRSFASGMALASSLLVFACGDSGTTSTSGGSGGAGGQGSGGGSTSITAGAGGAGSSCDRICEKKTVNDTTLGCGYDGSTCVSDCESAFDQILMSCYDEAYAYNDCFIDQPPESFQCTPNDPNNGSTLATTACDAEYDAYVTCLGGG